MPPEVAFVFLLLITNAITLGLWARSAIKGRRLENRLWGLAAGQGIAPDLNHTGQMPAMRVRGGAESNRLEQLEVQMDQMAQQMDRLIESQEFVSRVLADRAERLPDPRLRTPH